jgi:hypothetical protein
VSSGRANPSFIVNAVIDLEEVLEDYAGFFRHEGSETFIRF